MTRSREVVRELTLSPEVVELATEIVRSGASARSMKRWSMNAGQRQGPLRFPGRPVARYDVAVADMDLGRAELRFGLSDPRGLGANPRVAIDGQPLRLQPGGGSSGGAASSPGSTPTALTAPAARGRVRL